MDGAGNAGVGDPNKYVEFKVKAVLTEMESIKAQIREIGDYLSTYVSDKVLKDVKSKTEGLDNADPRRHDAEEQTASKARARDSEHIAKVQAHLNTIADVGVGFIKKTFGLVEMVYNQLKKSSPLLQAIENLFNLAWSLFFMPIGNKLGEMLIPAVIQLMDDVMEIWDAFEGMTLGDMISYAIEKGVSMLGDFIDHIAELLSGQTGIVGSISRMLSTLAGFIKEDAVGLLETLFNVASWILDHIKELIAVIIGFKVAALGLMVTQIFTTAASAIPIVGSAAAGAVAASAAPFIAGVGAISSAAIGTGIGLGVYGSLNRYGDGGHVSSTPGGQLAIVGEGGEGEYIIPDSKMDGLMGSGKTYYVTINSYSTEELKTIVKEVLSDEISQSRLRSGY